MVLQCHTEASMNYVIFLVINIWHSDTPQLPLQAGLNRLRRGSWVPNSDYVWHRRLSRVIPRWRVALGTEASLPDNVGRIEMRSFARRDIRSSRSRCLGRRPHVGSLSSRRVTDWSLSSEIRSDSRRVIASDSSCQCDPATVNGDSFRF